jgi:hypothetical protein
MGSALGYLITFLCTIIILLLGLMFKRMDEIGKKVAKQDVFITKEFTQRPTWPDCNIRMDLLEKDLKGHLHEGNSARAII